MLRGGSFCVLRRLCGFSGAVRPGSLILYLDLIFVLHGSATVVPTFCNDSRRAPRCGATFERRHSWACSRSAARRSASTARAAAPSTSRRASCPDLGFGSFSSSDRRKAAYRQQGYGQHPAQGQAHQQPGPMRRHADCCRVHGRPSPAGTACAQCGTAIPAGSKFCLQCGAKVDQGGFCASCGSQLPPGAKFCPSCGMPR